MKKTYIAIIAILMMGLAACSSEEIPAPTTEAVAVIEGTDAIESAAVLTVTEITESTVILTEQTDLPSESTQAPQKPPKEKEQTTTPREQIEPPATVELPEIIDL